MLPVQDINTYLTHNWLFGFNPISVNKNKNERSKQIKKRAVAFTALRLGRESSTNSRTRMLIPIDGGDNACS